MVLIVYSLDRGGSTSRRLLARAEFGVGFNPAGFCDTAGVSPSRRAVSHMITEIAQIDVKPGSEKDFEAAIAKAEPIFRRCKGWKSFQLHRGIEKPSRYRLMARWDTLENHTVDFRGSEDFTAWRGLVGQFARLCNNSSGTAFQRRRTQRSVPMAFDHRCQGLRQRLVCGLCRCAGWIRLLPP